LAEIKRMISSFSPRGTVSVSMSVTNPYLYSRLTNSSVVDVAVLMASAFPFWRRVPSLLGAYFLNFQQNDFKKIYRAKTPSTQSKTFTYFSEPWRLCVLARDTFFRLPLHPKIPNIFGWLFIFAS
jgi:hypothetical protein